MRTRLLHDRPLHPWIPDYACSFNQLRNESPMAMKKTSPTFAALSAQIAKLQQQAEALRAKEIVDVVAGIREAIKHYALTAADLGLGGAKSKAPMRVGRAATKKPGGKRSARPVKFADGQGNTWGGMG